MPPETPAFQRARSAEHKQQRAADLLEAARRLAAERGAGAVTLAETAESAGVHPSAVRRYFSSPEELFLRLAADAWQDWAEEVRERLGGRRGTPARLARVLAETLDAQPLFCDLLGHVIVGFEREATAQAARAYKLAALDGSAAVAEACRAALPELTARAASDLLAAATSMAAMLYQISNPTSALAELYAAEPRLAHVAGDFRPRLTRLLTATIKGLVG